MHNILHLRPMLYGLWMAATCLTACTQVDVTDASAGNWEFGADGPWAVRVEHSSVMVGLTPRALTLVTPAAGASHPEGMPDQVPGIVLIQGGLVERDRYLWLARHLASRGFAVALPDHVAGLALWDTEVARASADLLTGRLGDHLRGLVVGGHSLGGVMACQAALADDRMRGLFLLASTPADGDDVETWRRPVLSVAGTADTFQSEDGSRRGWERFGGQRWLAVVEGLTHFTWTDPGRDPTVIRERENAPPDLQATRRQALYALDAFLDLVTRHDAQASAALSGQPPLPRGLSVTRAQPH